MGANHSLQATGCEMQCFFILFFLLVDFILALKGTCLQGDGEFKLSHSGDCLCLNSVW